MKIKTIDNFLDKEQFRKIEQTLFSSNVPWFYTDTVASPDDKSGYFFIHHLYFDDAYQSKFANEVLLPIIYKLSFKRLLRARINCYPKVSKIIYNELHNDLDFPHKVALFSLNTNNGFTYFEDKSKINSKANQIILFDGKTKHGSAMQTDTNLRINININYI